MGAGQREALRKAIPIVQTALNKLLEIMEIIAVEVLGKAPDSFAQFKELFCDDFVEIIKLIPGYAKTFKSISDAIGVSFSMPTNSEYKNAIVLAASLLDPSERSTVQSSMAAAGFPVWDDSRLTAIRAAIENHTIEIPASAVLDDPTYGVFAKLFIADEIPTALLFGSGSAVAVTSYGLPNGMPTWKEFIKYICNETAKIRGWSPTDLTDALTNAAANPLEQLSLCQQEMISYWEETIDNLFSWPNTERKVKNVALYRNLHYLPFRMRMTTNYDSLYERINNVHIVNHYNLANAIVRWQNNQWSTRVAKIHGCVDSADDLIVTESDYNKRYASEDWNRIFTNIFSNYNVLFVGFGLSDPYFKFAFKKAIPPNSIPGRHYYIFSDEQRREKKEYYYKEYRLELITYPQGQHVYQSYYIQDLLKRYHTAVDAKKLLGVGLV